MHNVSEWRAADVDLVADLRAFLAAVYAPAARDRDGASAATCTEPRFEWLPAWECWSACVVCGRLAWSHAQSDPLADIANQKRQWYDCAAPVAPVMRASESDSE